MTLEEVREKAKNQEYVYYLYANTVCTTKIKKIGIFYSGYSNCEVTENITIKDDDNNMSVAIEDLFPNEQMAREENTKRIRNEAIKTVKRLIKEHHILISEITGEEEC